MIVYLYVVRAVCKDVDALFRGVDRAGEAATAQQGPFIFH